MSRKIFISYSHQDSNTAQGIARFLIRQGFEVWIDIDKLVSGQSWTNNIDEALASSDVFLAIISRNSVRRSEVLREIAEALKRKETDEIFQVLFTVIGSIHTSWFSDNKDKIAEDIIRHLEKVQYIQLNAKGTISISSMHNLIRALDGKIIYSDDKDFQKEGDYIYEAGMPEKTYDNESENTFFRVNASDLAPSTVFPFAMDNQWLPDDVMETDSSLRSKFLQKGFKDKDVQDFITHYQMKSLFLSLLHTRQIILNRASILNSHGIQPLYFEDSDCSERDREAFSKLLQNGSIVVFLYGDNELTPYISSMPSYDTMRKAVAEWNKLCSKYSIYCIRENWETPIDKHREEFVKYCTTLAFNVEMNEMLSECFGFDINQKKDFFTILKEIEMTVFLQTHITGTGQRSAVKGFSRSAFYKNFIVKNKSEDHEDPVLDCIFDEEKPYFLQLKKMVDVYYNSIFTNYFNCSALLPSNIKPEDTFIYQAYLKHGIKEVGTDELEYAFSEFFDDETLLMLISEIGEEFYLDNWSLERIVELRSSMRWREYIELLEYISNRSNHWEVDFSEIGRLVKLFVSCVTDHKCTAKDKTSGNSFIPAYTFRLCIGSKVLDIISTNNVRKLKSYPGIFSANNQNSLSLQFMLGDTSSKLNNVSESIFAPIKIFDGRTDHIGGNAYYEEICGFLTNQCDFVWIY